MTDISVVVGDITTLDVEAVVNAANEHLVPGGGVDHAIHSAGGPDIAAESRRRHPGGCPTGSAVTTGAGRMKARWVIHAVGPRWHGGGHGEDGLLASAWRAALEQAVEHGARSVAFPSISTGIYGFPVERAARLAIAEARHVLARLPEDQRPQVLVCAFSEADAAAYRAALDRAVPEV